MRPRSLLALRPVFTAALLALAFTGCSSSQVDESGQGASEVESPTYSTTHSPTPTEEPGPGDGNREVLLQAIDTALSEIAGSKLYSVESENGGTVWEVEVVTEAGQRYEIDLTSDGQKVVDGPEEKSSEAKHLQRVEAATVPISEIIDTAVAHAPGVVIELELDTAGGVIVWEVEVASADGQSVELDIDSGTGAIIG